MEKAAVYQLTRICNIYIYKYIQELALKDNFLLMVGLLYKYR